MEPILTSVQEYVKSGEYFQDARKWYNYKYIYPLSQKSFVMILAVNLFILLLGLTYNLKNLFPLVNQVRYSIRAFNIQSSANIIKADHFKNDPQGSIADIMIRNYVEHREEYDYDILKQQFIFIQNNSTRIVFRKFFNFMNIDNPSSPGMSYQKYIRRGVEILSTQYPATNEVVVTFNSIAKTSGGEIFENMKWQAAINYEIDKIDVSIPSNSRFNFAVTNYKLKLLEDKTKK